MYKDEFGKRMKCYEGVSKTKLTRKVPVIIRIDGKAFHTFTRGFKKPFDDVLIKSMQDTMKYLCENIQGCVLGYTQSDEITLVLTDYSKIESQPWFDYEVQKLCSISASMATMAFNKAFFQHMEDFFYGQDFSPSKHKENSNLLDKYRESFEKGAMFDSRCFNIPKEEVTNCVYWRQLDAIRNSIQMVGQANFSQKELQGKSCNEIQDMLMTQKEIDWNDLETVKKRGSCCIKDEEYGWYVDYNIPVFKGDGREYIEKLIL